MFLTLAGKMRDAVLCNECPQFQLRKLEAIFYTSFCPLFVLLAIFNAKWPYESDYYKREVTKLFLASLKTSYV